MNEIDLIKRYLEKSGAYRVQSISYYAEGFAGIVADGNTNLGVVAGMPVTRAFFFGNLEINAALEGVIVLANRNQIGTTFQTVLPGVTEAGFHSLPLAIGSGLNALGDGTYGGNRRVYGVGGNRIVWVRLNCGAATLGYSWNFNGYVFLLR